MCTHNSFFRVIRLIPFWRRKRIYYVVLYKRKCHINIFLISPQKHIVYSVVQGIYIEYRHRLFCGQVRKISILFFLKKTTKQHLI